MKAKDLIFEISHNIPVGESTCDIVKAGDPNKEIHKIAIAMMGTAQIIKEAHAWGADMLIVHETLFYDHMENITGRESDPVIKAKKDLIDSTGMVIYRYHDHAHAKCRDKDMITEGELRALGLSGELTQSDYFASYYFVPDEPITAREILNRCETKLGLKHVRAVGNLDHEVKKMAACFGTPGGITQLLSMPDVDLMMTGEICEWAQAEYVRDAAQLGFNKSLLVLTHIGSERDGMKLMTDRLQLRFPQIESRYFESDEVYL